MMRDVLYRLRLAVADRMRGMSRASERPTRDLGLYSEERGPIIFAPGLTSNSTSGGTVIHESVHEWLTISTPFGIFMQMLKARAKRDPSRYDQVDICDQAQWNCQEGLASYTEMCHLAVHSPGALDRAISNLPTASFEGPPYREAFDKLDRLMPLDPFGDRSELAGDAKRYAYIANAIVGYAMHGQVLTRFRRIDDLTGDAVVSYLEREGPDRRLDKALALLRADAALWRKVLDFTTQMDLERASVGPLVNMIAGMLPEHEFLAPESFHIAASEFAQSCDAALRSSPGTLPAVDYPPDWQDLVQFPDQRLTENHLKRLLAASRGNSGLLCTLTMAKESEVHVAALPFPTGVTDEETWRLMLKMLDDGAPSAEAVFSAKKLDQILGEAANAQVHLTFVRESWRIWDRTFSGTGGLRVLTESVAEIELSEERLRRLLEFRNLIQGGKWRVFPIHGAQCAAVIVNPLRMNCFALQSISGDAGQMVFSALVQRLGLEKLPIGTQQLPNWPVIRLEAQGFLP